MEDAVGFFIEHGSYGLMFAALVAAGMGMPLPEDIVFISGAILAQRGVTDLSVTVAVLASGVFVGHLKRSSFAVWSVMPTKN